MSLATRSPRTSRSTLFYRAVLIEPTLVCALVLGAGACSKDPVVDQRVVTLYALQDPANAITPGSSCAVPTSAFAFYEAAGDFEPDPNAAPRIPDTCSVTSESDAVRDSICDAAARTRRQCRRHRTVGAVTESFPTTGDVCHFALGGRP